MLEWNIVSMLTGATIAILASLVYSTLTNAFLSGGRFRSKWEAIVIYLTTAFALGLFMPLIESFWVQILQKLTWVKILGLLIVVGNAVVNQSVKRWRHTTLKTVIIYLLGVVLFVLG